MTLSYFKCWDKLQQLPKVAIRANQKMLYFLQKMSTSCFCKPKAIRRSSLSKESSFKRKLHMSHKYSLWSNPRFLSECFWLGLMVIADTAKHCDPVARNFNRGSFYELHPPKLTLRLGILWFVRFLG